MADAMIMHNDSIEEEQVVDYMLTTIDNPFNPFDDFRSWLLFDKEKGYDSCEKVARIANMTEDLSEKEKSIEINRAIDEIIKYDPLNIFTRAYPKEQKSEITR